MWIRACIFMGDRCKRIFIVLGVFFLVTDEMIMHPLRRGKKGAIHCSCADGFLGLVTCASQCVFFFVSGCLSFKVSSLPTPTHKRQWCTYLNTYTWTNNSFPVKDDSGAPFWKAAGQSWKFWVSFLFSNPSFRHVFPQEDSSALSPSISPWVTGFDLWKYLWEFTQNCTIARWWKKEGISVCFRSVPGTWMGKSPKGWFFQYLFTPWGASLSRCREKSCWWRKWNNC